MLRYRPRLRIHYNIKDLKGLNVVTNRRKLVKESAVAVTLVPVPTNRRAGLRDPPDRNICADQRLI